MWLRVVKNEHVLYLTAAKGKTPNGFTSLKIVQKWPI